MKKTVLVSALLLELGMPVHAATIDVDGSSCILSDAITAANSDTPTGGCSSGFGPDELVLTPGGSFTLADELPTITSIITVQGNGSTIQRDLNSEPFRILTINGGSLDLHDTTISQGDVSYTLAGAGPFNTGGGIKVDTGSLNIVNSTISTNLGGGVLFMNSTGLIEDSIISNNQGFDVYDYFYGAGVTVNCSQVTINRTTINENTTSAFPGGAGVIQSGSCGSDLFISNSTISGNESDSWGGGILSDAPGAYLILSQVTVSQNVCNIDGNGLGCGMNSFNTTAYVYQSLFSGNQNHSNNTYTNEINTDSVVAIDPFSLIGLNSNSGSYGLTPGYSIPTVANLSEIIDTNLSDNGGLTPTHALVWNGPAVDLVPEGSCFTLNDQTNKARPIDALGDGDASCDVGSYEAISDIIFKNGLEPPIP